MNERLKHIAQEAYDYSLLVDGTSYGEVYDKKFAELIVKECVRIDKENPDAAPGVEIARYFEVQE